MTKTVAECETRENHAKFSWVGEAK